MSKIQPGCPSLSISPTPHLFNPLKSPGWRIERPRSVRLCHDGCGGSKCGVQRIQHHLSARHEGGGALISLSTSWSYLHHVADVWVGLTPHRGTGHPGPPLHVEAARRCSANGMEGEGRVRLSGVHPFGRFPIQGGVHQHYYPCSLGSTAHALRKQIERRGQGRGLQKKVVHRLGDEGGKAVQVQGLLCAVSDTKPRLQQ